MMGWTRNMRSGKRRRMGRFAPRLPEGGVCVAQDNIPLSLPLCAFGVSWVEACLVLLWVCWDVVVGEKGGAVVG